MQEIKIRYIGKNDLITCEYDGVKYNFSKTNTVQIIPLEVFKHWNSDTNPYRNEIIPFQDDAVVETEQKKQTMADEVEKISQDVSEMQGRPFPEPQPLPQAKSNKHELTREEIPVDEEKPDVSEPEQSLINPDKKRRGGRKKGSKNK